MSQSGKCTTPLVLLTAFLVGCASAPVPPQPVLASGGPMSVPSAVKVLSATSLAPQYFREDSDNIKYVTPSPTRVLGSGVEVDLSFHDIPGMAPVTTTCRCRYSNTAQPLLLQPDLFWPGMKLTCYSFPSGREHERYDLLISDGKPADIALAWQVMSRLSAPETATEHQQFDAAVADFRARRAGPDIGEDVRMHKVLAEAAVRDKRLWDAVAEFTQGLALAPWWSQGNYNLALVYAELHAYAPAARHMQRYLKLAPDAANARQAQDKIYEWTDAARRAGG